MSSIVSKMQPISEVRNYVALHCLNSCHFLVVFARVQVHFGTAEELSVLHFESGAG